ncbi:uncharacterized protein BXIN_2190 [Babesia sp. Xinjiang]|uniref:uncharacterized protein n=1 Tax=Babesia sp. Xinjiang TaxID=462227 RepID=UPI000A247216|nr:uncharacterized protein BXIN_2190 [Babesia sp. Xinjiang]ORM40351.1 hypothetical protein BXIN_2190 [Babesia sp. Xinjiang]
MAAKVRDIKFELVTLAVIVAAACLLSSGSWRKNRLISWLTRFNSSFDNIYQLLPILQKNSRALFLVFNDLASAINSVAAAHNGETPLSKESVRALLNQEWVQLKLRKAQDSVLEEFGLDASGLDEAIERFRNDDQVQMYINGVEMMYNAVLDGGYPRCPGVEHCEGMTKQFVLSVIAKVVSAKQTMLSESANNVGLSDRIEIEVVYREMQRLGYTTPLDAVIAFKNTENCYQYDFEFVQARQRLYLGYVGEFVSDAPNSEADAPQVSAEELRLMLETLEADSPLFLMVFDGDSATPEFVSLVKRRAEDEPKATLAWITLTDSPQEYVCKTYPAALRFLGGKFEALPPTLHTSEMANANGGQSRAAKPKGSAKKRRDGAYIRPTAVTEQATKTKKSELVVAVKTSKAVPTQVVRKGRRSETKKVRNEKSTVQVKAQLPEKHGDEAPKRSTSTKRKREMYIEEENVKNVEPVAKRQATSNVMSRTLGFVVTRIMSGIQRATRITNVLLSSVISPFSRHH